MAEARGYSVPLLARAPGDILLRLPGQSVSAAAFLAAARALAARLPADGPPGALVGAPGGVPIGVPVVNLCTDRFGFALGFAACLLRGRVSLLLGDRSAPRLAALAAAYPGLHALIDAPTPDLALPATMVGTEPPAAARSGEPLPAFPADRLAAIVFTSGSTGEPVGHRKSWGALAARSIDAGRRFRLRPDRPAAIVATVPPYHMYGFETSVLLPLHAAAASWCGPAFYPVDVAAALAACPEPRVLVTTPLQLRALLAAPGSLPPLARVISATAPLPVEMAAAAEHRWGTEVWEIFGATEVGSIASRRTVAGEVWQSYPRVRLRQSSAPARVPAGVAADDDPPAAGVAVHAPHAMPWPLSDRLELCDPTRFRLLGRRTDLVKLGGRRVSLAGLTRILTGIEGVEDGVFVAPDDLETEPTARLLAFAVAPRLTSDDILAALRARIEPLFLPRRVVRVLRLPRDPLGKLPAGALAALRAQADDA